MSIDDNEEIIRNLREEVVRLNKELESYVREKDAMMDQLFSVGPFACHNGIKHDHIDECLYCLLDKTNIKKVLTQQV